MGVFEREKVWLDLSSNTLRVEHLPGKEANLLIAANGMNLYEGSLEQFLRELNVDWIQLRNLSDKLRTEQSEVRGFYAS